MTPQVAPPFEGLRVLDFSRVIAGPACTQNLADFGATVVKIENPAGGDDGRNIAGPRHGGESHFYLAFNRGKKSVAFNTTKPEGLDLALQMADQVDVVIENFRPGVATVNADWNFLKSAEVNFPTPVVQRQLQQILLTIVARLAHGASPRLKPCLGDWLTLPNSKIPNRKKTSPLNWLSCKKRILPKTRPSRIINGLRAFFTGGTRLVGVADKKGSAMTGPGGALSLLCFDQLAADFAGLANQLFNFLTLAPTDRALKAGQVFLHPPSHL